MTCHLVALCMAANDPQGLASFWAGVLGWELIDPHDNPDPHDRADPQDSADLHDPVLLPHDDTGFLIRFLSTDEPKTGPNQMHFDLTSASLEDQQRTVAKVLELGGRHIDIGQLPEEPHVVLADPEGNELCVIEPDNNFLADCGFIGALSSDGTQDVGYFWSAALGWPLVWDQDQETAIRSPDGGPKVTWGGPPVGSKRGTNRLHFHVAPPSSGGLHAEVERLVALGASRVGTGEDDGGRVALLDPDGNEFCVVTES